MEQIKKYLSNSVIGGVGLIENIKNKIDLSLKNENSTIILIGKTFGHIEQSCF